ncbi:uncharacterized protein LOC127280095 [Leptopilina boulardi]|uniref:uncharacterized protein LOC127280095 n=1 Tax=Leptopilina boulardi TaxID=63433 RepID=UPI0021F5E4F9|nr:uncharacterized protein LOC127280095 [Leptopilina boulardi]
MSITDPQNSENVEDSKGEIEEQKPEQMQMHMALQVQILDEVIKLRTDMALCIKQLSDLGKRIEKIEQSQGTSHDNEYNPQALGLPIETIAAYQALESDETRLEQLKHFLVSVGGFTLRGTVKDFVRMTFSDAFVAMNLTWCLGTSKIHFRDSQISKTFFAACRRIQRLKQPSRALYEEAAKVALKNATQRHYIEVTGRNNSAFSEKKKEKLVMEGSPSE